MTAGSEGVVYRVTCVSGYDNVFLDRDIAQSEADMLGVSVQRLPLATPEHTALVEAAMKFYGCVVQQLAEPFPLFESATFSAMMDVMRRIYHGHPLPTIKESLTDDAARAAGGKDG